MLKKKTIRASNVRTFGKLTLVAAEGLKASDNSLIPGQQHSRFPLSPPNSHPCDDVAQSAVPKGKLAHHRILGWRELYASPVRYLMRKIWIPRWFQVVGYKKYRSGLIFFVHWAYYRNYSSCSTSASLLWSSCISGSETTYPRAQLENAVLKHFECFRVAENPQIMHTQGKLLL